MLAHTKKNPPAVDDVCTLLSFSIEKGQQIVRELTEEGIIDEVEGGYGYRLYIKDHLKIEELPQEAETSKLDEELKKFKGEKDKLTKKVELIKAEQEQKQKDLFAEIERKLKGGKE